MESLQYYHCTVTFSAESSVLWAAFEFFLKGPIERRCITMGELENFLSISRFFYSLYDRNDTSCVFICAVLSIGWAARTDCT